MSSFFSKFRSSKKKGTAANAPYEESTYSTSSNNSSQVSLTSKSQASLQAARSSSQVPAPKHISSSPSFAHSLQRTGTSSKPFSAKGSSSKQQQQLLQQQKLQQQQQLQQFHQHQQIGKQQVPLFLRQPYIRAALVKGSFQTIVELPKYVDLNEWLALNMFEFNNNIVQFVSLVSDYIDDSHKMSAGPGYDYLWIDTNKQAVRLPAVTYIDYTISWITSKFYDPALFPTKPGVPFPPTFNVAVKSIYVQLFRILAYLTHHHYDKIIHLNLESHYNSLFCHFASFGKTFNLFDRNEMAPLQPFIKAFEAQGKIA